MTRVPPTWSRRSFSQVRRTVELASPGLPEQQACAAAPALVDALSVRLLPYGWRHERRRGRYLISRRVGCRGCRAGLNQASRKEGLA